MKTKQYFVPVILSLIALIYSGCSRESIVNTQVVTAQGVFVLYEGSFSAGSGDYAFIDLSNDNVTNPATVKFVIISHGHGDHVGGAKLMQDRFGARLIMGGPDWDMIEQSVNRFPNGKPKRDMVASDGQKVTLGDTTVTLVATPGHTPGTHSMIFQVKDNGKPLTVAYSGGTAFNFPNDVPHFDMYIASQRKMAKAAADAGATVLMSNHSEFDNAVTKIRMMVARKTGEPHPFEVGAEAIARYFKVTDECAQLARYKLQQAEAKPN